MGLRSSFPISCTMPSFSKDKKTQCKLLSGRLNSLKTLIKISTALGLPFNMQCISEIISSFNFREEYNSLTFSVNDCTLRPLTFTESNCQSFISSLKGKLHSCSLETRATPILVLFNSFERWDQTIPPSALASSTQINWKFAEMKAWATLYFLLNLTFEFVSVDAVSRFFLSFAISLSKFQRDSRVHPFLTLKPHTFDANNLRWIDFSQISSKTDERPQPGSPYI